MKGIIILFSMVLRFSVWLYFLLRIRDFFSRKSRFKDKEKVESNFGKELLIFDEGWEEGYGRGWRYFIVQNLTLDYLFFAQNRETLCNRRNCYDLIFSR
ncbi:hypothetical protein C1631_008555 [Chryseobacterium phosphatilyticum]|uniref:Uncharacterized protein n=1 Tax=Chryseobacterium phosphatilyticum TaxID=475075 RepID=A0A316XGY0_9FLAO|nr:hypothetical protein C1631_008555 [Chryseobacterium phosphatilyticum]